MEDGLLERLQLYRAALEHTKTLPDPVGPIFAKALVRRLAEDFGERLAPSLAEVLTEASFDADGPLRRRVLRSLASWAGRLTQAALQNRKNPMPLTAVFEASRADVQRVVQRHLPNARLHAAGRLTAVQAPQLEALGEAGIREIAAALSLPLRAVSHRPPFEDPGDPGVVVVPAVRMLRSSDGRRGGQG